MSRSSEFERESERLNADLCGKYKRAWNWLIDNRIKFHPFLCTAMDRALRKRGVPIESDESLRRLKTLRDYETAERIRMRIK